MRSPGKLYLDEKDYMWYDKIVIGFLDILNTLVRPINHWSSRRKRRIQVSVDSYDVWSADHTLALIIHPVLVKLKEQKQGSPFVDDDDVPDHLKSTSAPPKENDWDTDNNHHDRWEYVLDEMIWAFEQHTDPDCNDSQFHHNIDQLEVEFVPITEGDLVGRASSALNVNHQKDPTKPAYWVDKEGEKAHRERISNGLRLFAKYYSGLWD